jgi:mono/diheme cytochrome c family protein
MRRALRILGRIVLALVLVIVLAVAVLYVLAQRRLNKSWQVSVPSISVPTDADAVARGHKLVTVYVPCGDCHGADFGGRMMSDDLMFGRLWASNLTRGRGGIAGTYSDADWLRTFLHGVKPDGRTVVFMPSHEFHLTEADTADIIAFFRAAPPIDRERPATRIGPVAAVLSFGSLPLFPAELIDHEHAGFAPVVTRVTAVDRGHDLVTKAACNGCHQPDFTGGGGPPPGASNITPVGIGTWHASDFIRAIRDHKRPNGSAIDEAMPRGYGQMSDQELEDIFTYLQTIPAKGSKSKRQM